MEGRDAPLWEGTRVMGFVRSISIPETEETKRVIEVIEPIARIGGRAVVVHLLNSENGEQAISKLCSIINSASEIETLCQKLFNRSTIKIVTGGFDWEKEVLSFLRAVGSPGQEINLKLETIDDLLGAYNRAVGDVNEIGSNQGDTYESFLDDPSVLQDIEDARQDTLLKDSESRNDELLEYLKKNKRATQALIDIMVEHIPNSFKVEYKASSVLAYLDTIK